MAYTFKHGDQPLEGITIQRAVGRGGFGEVYYAVADSGKQLAVKYLRENPEIELRGIAQVMNLKSPHLITIYDVRRNNEGEPFVMMEYIGGPSLRELLIAEPNGLGPQKAAFFLTNIAKGLSYLHERGVVHRDLKPGNIFYDDGYVKIGDYGLSKHISVSAHSGNTVSVGTVHYMAPEIGSGSYTRAIDIYAMGVMLFEMLTGRLPFTGSSMGEILMRHMNDRPDLAGIPEPFHSVIVRALAKDPADRYQNVDEMVEALTSVNAVSDSIASFDPVTLTSVPRSPHTADEQTLTTPPHPAPPPLDVREPAAGVDGIPPIPRLPGEARRGGRARVFRADIGKALRNAGRNVVSPTPAPNHAGGGLSHELRARLPHLITLAIVAIAVAVGLALFSGHSRTPEAAAAMAFMIIGSTVGALFAHFHLVRRMLAPNALLERCAYAGAALVGMIPGIALAADENVGDLPNAAMAIAAMLILLNWRVRIDAGFGQPVRMSAAVMPAVIGLVCAGAADTDRNFFFALPAICATVALLIPSAAIAWPWLPSAAAGRQPTTETEQRMVSAARRYDRGGSDDAVQPAVNVTGFPQQPAVGPPPPPPAPPPPAPAHRHALEAQPSFVGRAANAGLSFLAKMLLLFGVVWAIGYEYRVPIQTPYEQGFVGGSGVQITRLDKYGGGGTNVEIPRPVVLLPFLLGTVLLVTARRQDGAWHFLRGFLGCAIGITAACLALGPSAEELRLFLQNDWNLLRFDARAGDPHAEELIRIGVALGIALVLLFWPKRLKRRQVVI